jgi:hypothetical protein
MQAAHACPIVLAPKKKALQKMQAQEQASSRKTGISEVHKRVPRELGHHELALIAQNYFQQLGQDSRHRIFKFFAWDEAKTKVVSVGYTA